MLVQQPTTAVGQHPTTVTAVGQGTVNPPSYKETVGTPDAMPAKVTSDPKANYNYNSSHKPGYQGGIPLASGVAGDKNAVPDPPLSYGQKPGVSAP